jgi:hypothetical protein
MSSLETASREELLAVIATLQAQVAALQVEVERLKGQSPGGKSSPPLWVKPNVPPREKSPRIKRKQSFRRRRQEPTEVQVHACDVCPDCGRKLVGGWVHRVREVIEIPQTPVTITEHQIVARYCGVCRKRCIPSVEFSSLVVGSHRVGVRLMSLIAWLHVVGRWNGKKERLKVETQTKVSIEARPQLPQRPQSVPRPREEAKPIDTDMLEQLKMKFGK